MCEAYKYAQLEEGLNPHTPIAISIYLGHISRIYRKHNNKQGKLLIWLWMHIWFIHVLGYSHSWVEYVD